MITDGVIRPGGVVLTKRLLDYCAFPPLAKIVDVGCGTGITVEYLRDVHGLNVVGVDLSEERLRQGRERSADLDLVQAPGEDMPFTDASVDGVLAECSLSVMQDISKALAEFCRILTPGGKLALTDIYVRNVGDTSQVGNMPDSGCISGYLTHGSLTKMLKEKGFKIIAWEDQSDFLREFVACFIMEYGSVEKLWQCLSTRINDRQICEPTPKTTKLGYFLLVAEKS
ncbi:DVU_1556 family methyltransferase [Sporomusa malonica]|uniref:Ubiquinone/menaquinone biosynthesis C-methylase UbiE n=1 Tax=Sporomusa malonica TaxID=112901 RepID=A0A1W2EQQ1_9FIRM|nr:class I SAM-dependent methyltransferase [Sporomusa malonica]SMD11576.1 Ubiquinone/menaquinone biosynthesis C-methylase UbiE [Sporomusa malonica]